MFSINIGEHSTLNGIATATLGTDHCLGLPAQTIHSEHQRLLVGSILDASVVAIGPEITTHHVQQHIHPHVLQQGAHQHLQPHHQPTLQLQTQHDGIEATRVEIGSICNGLSGGQLESGACIGSLVGEVGADGHRCFLCNGHPDPYVNIATAAFAETNRKLSDLLSKLVGTAACKLLGPAMCQRCFYEVEKIDCLEMQLSSAKLDFIRKCETTLQLRDPDFKLRIPHSGSSVEAEDEPYESAAEEMVDDPNDPDVTLSSLRQSRRRKPKRKIPFSYSKRLNSLSVFLKNHSIKTLSPASGKRGRGRPRKKEAEETRPREGAITQECPCCQKVVEVVMYLRHLGSHKVFPCPFCLAVYKRKDIKTHIAETHQDEPSFPCSGCDLSFDTFGKLRRHSTSVHMAIEIERAKCPLCSKIFSSNNGLKVHIETIHENSQMFDCPVCKESFNQRGNMKNHFRRVHGGETARRLLCDTCSKGFICPSDLRKHVERVHLKIKKDEVLCRACSKPFSDQRALKVHVNAVHTRAIKFPCPDCKLVFHSLTNMVTHRRRMHGENGGRKHACVSCTKAFCSPSDLRTHIKVVHENVRKYVCDICGQSFKVGSHLKYHHRRHTGETPYKCPHCNKCFHGPSHISDHVRKVHKTVYMGVNQRRRLNLPEDAPPPPPGILPSKSKLEPGSEQPLQHLQAQVVIPQPSIPTMHHHIPQHILQFGGHQSGHMIATSTMMEQHVVHHGHYANIQFDQVNNQSPVPMVVRLVPDGSY